MMNIPTILIGIRRFIFSDSSGFPSDNPLSKANFVSRTSAIFNKIKRIEKRINRELLPGVSELILLPFPHCSERISEDDVHAYQGYHE